MEEKMGFYKTYAREQETNLMRAEMPELAAFRDILFSILEQLNLATYAIVGAMHASPSTVSQALAGKTVLHAHSVVGLAQFFSRFRTVEEEQIARLFAFGLRAVLVQYRLGSLVVVDEDECRRRIQSYRRTNESR